MISLDRPSVRDGEDARARYGPRDRQRRLIRSQPSVEHAGLPPTAILEAICSVWHSHGQCYRLDGDGGVLGGALRLNMAQVWLQRTPSGAVLLRAAVTRTIRLPGW